MPIKNFLLATRRGLHLTSIHKVLRALRKRKVSLKDLNALEVFGGSGDLHAKDYAPYVSTLEVWEINPKQEMPLKKNLPNAKVKITDSYKEIKKAKSMYNLIVVDNPMSTYDEHCEHFDLFPDIFRIAMDSTIIILNVIPEIDDHAKKQYPYLFNETQLASRKSFYGTNQPEKISFDKIVETYRKHATTNGFSLDWYFFQKRTFVYYLVLKIRKS